VSAVCLSSLLHFSKDIEACSDDVADAEAKLRERRPTSANTDELLGFMEETRRVRRLWIVQTGPTITDILRRYPRLGDLPQAVCMLLCVFFVSLLY